MYRSVHGKSARDGIAPTSCTSLYTGFIHRFMYTAANEWLAIGFFNLWIILALLKGDSFSRNSSRIHLIQFISIWGIAFLVTLIPYTLKGPDTYTSGLLTYPLVAGDAKLDYYFYFLPIQVAYALTSVTLPHLIYTLKKRVYVYRLLLTYIDLIFLCRVLYESLSLVRKVFKNSNTFNVDFLS